MIRTRPSVLQGTSALVAALMTIASDGADAIPAFARRYGVSCSLCHNPVPALTAFGEAFAGNGFRFSSGEEPRDTLATGDPLLDLAKNLPLAIRLDAYMNAYTNGDVATDFETPWNLKILSGGAISKKLSYYMYFFLYERGEVGGIEDAFVYVNDIADRPVDLAIGQFQVSDPLFKRELRLEYQDYVIYRTRVGLQPADLTYDRGFMGIVDVYGFTVTGEVVNGNGRGVAGDDRRLDNDPLKNWFGHVSRDIVPGVRLGLMGYWGKQTGAAEGGPETTNRLSMVGGDGTVSWGPLELNAQYIHREDTQATFAPGEPSTKTDGGFAELLYRPAGSRWHGFALYNRVDANRPLLNARLGGPSNVSRYETLTGGAGYLVRRNFRALGEVTYDLEVKETRWTLGLVTAF